MGPTVAVGITLLAGHAEAAAARLCRRSRRLTRKELAYSQCLRAHGEPGFPDPQPSGGITINGSQDHLNGALMNSANRHCQDLMPKTKPLTGAQQRQDGVQAVKFAVCMRTHGIPNFSDPTVTAQGVHFRPPSGVSKPCCSPRCRRARSPCPSSDGMSIVKMVSG